MTQKVSHELRELFRRANRQNIVGVFEAVGRARKIVGRKSFDRVLVALRTMAISYRALPGYTSQSYEELTFNPHLEPLSLAEELAWAGVWLPYAAAKLNTHTQMVVASQGLFSAGRDGELLDLLSAHVLSYGWSFWAVELMLGLTQTTKGDAELKSFAALLRDRAPNRASSMFAVALSERNESTFPFESFRRKCQTTIPNFHDSWLRSYFPYRALCDIDDPLIDLPIILCSEITSSVFDYYESLIFSLNLIRNRTSLKHLRQVAAQTTSALIRAGIKDYRLAKLSALQGVSAPIVLSGPRVASSHPSADLRTALLARDVSGIPLEERHGVAGLVQGHLKSRLTDSSKARLELANLERIGTNFRSLPLGFAILNKARLSLRANAVPGRVPIGVELVLPSFDIVDIFAGESSNARDLLRNSIAEIAAPEETESKVLLDVLEGRRAMPDFQFSDESLIWLGYELVRDGRFAECAQIVTRVASRGGTCLRASIQLEIYLKVESGDLSGALLSAGNFLSTEPEAASELNIEAIFEGRRWSDFRNLDSIDVGLVAHHAHVATGSTDIRFICLMAFRTFYLSSISADIEERWSAADSATRLRMVSFLRSAWTDDNLSMVDKFRSTQEMRHERIRVLQNLLSWDTANSAQYSTQITELTVDETLWAGILEVNQTRVFVNEAAIQRWAEKEVLPEFERWRQLKESGSAEPLPEDYTARYQFAPSVVPLVVGLAVEQRTTANAALLAIVDRVYKRFLRDPTDGLDSFLSSRVRHGTLRGTLLGPFEDQNLLVSGATSEETFVARWLVVADAAEREGVLALFREASAGMLAVLRRALEEKLRIRSPEYKEGLFTSDFNPSGAASLLTIFGNMTSFSYFVTTCFSVFWIVLEPLRKGVAEYLRNDVKMELQAEADKLVQALRSRGASYSALISAVQGASTSMQYQANAAADWFLPRAGASKQTYRLSEAIEIARRATKNVYGRFDAQVNVGMDTDEVMLVSARYLATIVDCLFIVFANAWNHSGLQGQLGDIDVHISPFIESEFLLVTVTSDLAPEVRARLVDGELATLREKYAGEVPVHLVPKEGGSGLAKLAWISSSVKRGDESRHRLEIGIDEVGRWYTRFALPLEIRDGIYEAAG